MTAPDPHNLDRFIQAQADTYPQALAELKAGLKQTHWMWFIFPQFAGLGHSAMAERYAIQSLDEARAYLAHPLLGPRLIESAQALLQLKNQSALDILGVPDDQKLKSSATLFATVSPDHSPFHRVLDQYYEGQSCSKTLYLTSNQQ